MRVGAGLLLAGLVVAAPAVGVKTAHAQANVNSTLVLKTTFDDNKPGPWPVNQHITVSGGRYNVSVTPGHYSQYHPDKPAKLGDGAIAAMVQLSGSGAAGIMGHFRATPDDKWSMYACFITNKGMFGCVKDVNDSFTPIAKMQHSSAIKVGANNLVVLSFYGGHVLLQINGHDVATYVDKNPLPAGNWGVFGDNDSKAPFTAHYDAIAIVKAS